MKLKVREKETAEDARQGMAWLCGIESCAASDSMIDGNVMRFKSNISNTIQYNNTFRY